MFRKRPKGALDRLVNNPGLAPLHLSHQFRQHRLAADLSVHNGTRFVTPSASVYCAYHFFFVFLRCFLPVFGSVFVWLRV